MSRKVILYLLKFNSKDLFKIGITTNLTRRIKCIENRTGWKVDFYDSEIITLKKNSQVRLLEQNLLQITQDHICRFSEDSELGNCSEYRHLEAWSLIKDYLDFNKKFYPQIKFFKGIDICGNYSSALPKVYFPPHIETNGISKVLNKDFFDYCKKEDINTYEIINELMYTKIKEWKIERDSNNTTTLQNPYMVQY